MKVVILCGGFGTRMGQDTEVKPKPLMEIGGKPILWHIMKTFAHYGHKDFILCLGYKSEVIKNYFLNYDQLNNDFTVELGTGQVQVHTRNDEDDWRVTLVETGLHTMTGARVKRVESYVDGDHFMVTYGDGVTDCNINALLEFHHSKNKIGTVTGVSHPSSYGELDISDDLVISFREKPQTQGSMINGGFFVFNTEFFSYLEQDENCVLEREPLEHLTQNGQLAVYSHKGYWRCMDTYRDMLDLNQEWDSGRAGWKIWQ